MLKPIKNRVEIKVPVRADVAGAFSDIPYYLAKYNIGQGEVVNVALPAYLLVIIEAGRQIDPITLEMPDMKEKIVGDLVDLAAQESNNASQVASNFIRLFALDSAGLKITITSNGKIPPASGLGTSSAVGVGLVRALSEMFGLKGINAPEFNYLIEQAMGVTGGKQDSYASFLGGINHLKFWGPDRGMVSLVSHFDDNSKENKWLLDHLLVYFSGESRSSGVANAKAEKRVKKDPKILTVLAKEAKNAFVAIEKMNIELLKRIVKRDRENWFELTDGNWYTPRLRELAKVGENLGFEHRAGGAGAGGCLLFFGDPAKKKELVSKLQKISGRIVY